MLWEKCSPKVLPRSVSASSTSLLCFHVGKRQASTRSTSKCSMRCTCCAESWLKKPHAQPNSNSMSLLWKEKSRTHKLIKSKQHRLQTRNLAPPSTMPKCSSWTKLSRTWSTRLLTWKRAHSSWDHRSRMLRTSLMWRIQKLSTQRNCSTNLSTTRVTILLRSWSSTQMNSKRSDLLSSELNAALKILKNRISTRTNFSKARMRQLSNLRRK